jgi:hypothetical protein
MQLTDALVQAFEEALDREANERDPAERATLLAWTRVTLWQWRSGLLTADEAVDNLRSRGSRDEIDSIQNVA